MDRYEDIDSHCPYQSFFKPSHPLLAKGGAPGNQLSAAVSDIRYLVVLFGRDGKHGEKPIKA